MTKACQTVRSAQALTFQNGARIKSSESNFVSLAETNPRKFCSLLCWKLDTKIPENETRPSLGRICPAIHWKPTLACAEGIHRSGQLTNSPLLRYSRNLCSLENPHIVLSVRYKLMLLLEKTPRKYVVFSPFVKTSTPCVVTIKAMQNVPVALYYSSVGGLPNLKHETNTKCLKTRMCRICWRGMKVIWTKRCQSCAKVNLLWSCERIPESTAVYPFIK